MVFQQEAPDQPMVHNGTVHAPDAELAMLNARDVFVRRPEAVALWVVPAEAIFTQTQEELAKAEPGNLPTSQPVDFYVFAKFTQQAQCRHVGEVQAASPQAAVTAAVAKYGEQQPLWWWVFPVSAVHKNESNEAEPMFSAARYKTFKDQAEYPVVTMMRELRAKANTNHKDTEDTK
jgi:ring-1,2-phenylacetyl-CoA epoxidase subunit PaaB